MIEFVSVILEEGWLFTLASAALLLAATQCTNRKRRTILEVFNVIAILYMEFFLTSHNWQKSISDALYDISSAYVIMHGIKWTFRKLHGGFKNQPSP